MTDKQIIIDGVDVSGCKHYKHNDKNSGWSGCTSKDEEHIHSVNPLCCEKKDCLYKQLKRKEQECEELNNDNHTLLVTRQKLLNDLWIAEESLKDFKEICDKQCEQLEVYKMEAEEGKEINAELKAELTRANCQIADDEILQCDMREAIEELKAKNKELKETFDGLFKVQYKLADNNKKLRQCLTEIKVLSENVYCLTNALNRDMALFAKEILQKISECEGNNEYS